MNQVEFNKNDPQVAQFVKCYPAYRGRKPVRVSSCTRYNMHDYWDGGSRNYVQFIHLPTGRYLPLSELQYEHQTAGNPFKLAIGTVTLTPDVAAVENVIFCGKDLGLRVYVCPDTFVGFNK